MDKCISIVIPVYNAGKYLRDCLESIVAQTYKNLEIILVDDGSTDDSGDVCDQYAELDSRIRVLHQANQGQSSARNQGLDVAQGEYIGFVDSDDQISPIMYEALILECERENADIASVLSTTTLSELYKGNVEGIDYTVSNQPLFSYLEKEGHSVWRRLYKKELFEKIRFANVKHDEDVIISYELYALCKKSVCLNAALYYWNQENTSLSRGKVKTLDNQSEVIYRRLKEQHSDIVSVAKLRSIQTEYRIMTRAIKYGLETKELKNEFKETYKKYLMDIKQNIGNIRKSPLFSRKDVMQMCALFVLTPIYVKIRLEEENDI